MLPRPVPHSVSQWKSELSLGPARTQGKWSPGTGTHEAKLGAIPYTTPQGMTIYTTGLSVSWGDKPPVTLQPASRLRVRGPHCIAAESVLRHHRQTSKRSIRGSFPDYPAR